MSYELKIAEGDEKEDLEQIVESSISGVVRTYLSSVRSIRDASGLVMPHLAKWLRSEIEKSEKIINKYLPDSSEEEVEFDTAREFVQFASAMQRWSRLTEDKSLLLLGRSLFMQIFCEFDSFTGNLLKAIYLKNFDLLKGISREISLVDLLGYKDIEAASRAMLEKEIESFRRDSYVEQFSQLEKKFAIALKKFPEWPDFVEMSQRRNLFAHNDGVVSDQYLAVCKKEGCVLEEGIELGSKLYVTPKYLSDSLILMSKIGYMLGHTLWGKIFPAEVQEMQESLNSILYDCLEDKRWSLAACFGEFGLTEAMRRGVTDIDYRIRVVNCAIGMKFSGDEKGAKKLLASVDWTASYRDFKLACLVLEDKFDEAASLMREIGKSGELLRQEYYHSWPLFEKFREREEFYSLYEEIYGESYEAESAEISMKIASSRKKVVKSTASKRVSKTTKKRSLGAVEKGA